MSIRERELVLIHVKRCGNIPARFFPEDCLYYIAFSSIAFLLVMSIDHVGTMLGQFFMAKRLVISNRVS